MALVGNEIVGGSDGTGGGGGGGGGASGGGGAGDAAVYQGTSAVESSDFEVQYTSATTLTLSDLPFPALLENFVGIYEYSGDHIVKTYDVANINLDWTWTPTADATTGVLEVTPAAFGATNTFVVVMRGPKRSVLEVLTDLAGMDMHQSPRDFAAAFATATTIAITGMEMDPDQADIRAVAEFAANGRVRMAYTRGEWAFTWAAGATGAGVLTIADATMQATSSFVVFIAGPEHGTAGAAATTTAVTSVKYIQPLDPQGNVITGTDTSGLVQYSTPHHFSAAWQAAESLDLSGMQFTIQDYTQFVTIEAWDASGGYIGQYSPRVNVFAWDGVNDRVTVTGAAFVSGGEVKVTVVAPDRTINQPADSQNTLVANHYELNSDDSAIPLLVAAQTFTNLFVDVSSEISMVGYNQLKLWMAVDIGDSTDLQVRILEKHESGGTEEFQTTISTVGTGDVQFQPGHWELSVDADSLFTLVYRGDGCTPYVQVQIKAGVLGAGVDADLDSCEYSRSTF